jgi:hypothetical protein
VQDDEEIIESLNKLLPKEYIVPEKKSDELSVSNEKFEKFFSKLKAYNVVKFK